MPKKSRDLEKTPVKTNVVTNAKEGAVAPAISQLVQIFSERMEDVEFPGVSAASLRQSHQSVEDASAALDQAQEVLLKAKEKVAELQDALAESRSALSKDAHRAKGYAMIFAEDDPALLEEVRGLNLKFKKPKAAKKPQIKATKASSKGPEKLKAKAKAAPKFQAAEGDEEHEESVTMDPDFEALDADIAA